MIKNILQLLEDTASKYPNRIALKDETVSLSFNDYLTGARSVGSFIGSKYSETTYAKPVIVMVDRKVEPLVAFMGVIYSGNFYVPVDNRTPPERLRNIIEVLSPLAVIGFSDTEQKNCASVSETLPFHMFNDIISSPISSKLLAQKRAEALDVDPVYSIFTSGSTGVPKAVAISHRSILDLSAWLSETFNFNESDVIGNQTPFYFDASVKDIYISLRTGATLLVIPPKCFSFPNLLAETLNQNQVTTILWATSAVVLTAKSGILETTDFSHLKRVFFAGEAMFGKHLNVWRNLVPDCQYINLYGPTEVTVDSTYYIVDRDFSDGEVIPIGRNCDNKGLFILDDSDKVLFGQAEGELAVRGTGVALGYYNNPEQTQKVFIQNPLHNHYRDIIYKTGDFVRRNSRNEIEFIGRRDFQVKHMGNRIELGEIESAVYGINDVKHAACVYDSANEKIVLFYTAELEISPRIFLKELASSLPKYMYPNRFIHLPEMPLNPNGKIDRKVIKAHLSDEKN